ncbi:hypothetical protein BD410DRAFT_795666, partial [Rickenella mellea]
MNTNAHVLQKQPNSAHIHNLPEEVLCNIISLASLYRKPHERFKAVVPSTCVCRRWRQAVLDCSTLWSTIYTRLTPLNVIAELLHRSKDAPLVAVVQVFKETAESDQTAAELVFKHSSRIRVLDFKGETLLHFQCLAKFFSFTLHDLEVLRISRREQSYHNFIGFDLTKFSYHLSRPLKTLALFGDMDHLPIRTTLFRGVSRLSLTLFYSSSLAPVLEMLKQNSVVEDFQLTVQSKFWNHPSPIVASLPSPGHFPRLRRLSLDMPAAICKLAIDFFNPSHDVDCTFTLRSFSAAAPIIVLPKSFSAHPGTPLQCVVKWLGLNISTNFQPDADSNNKEGSRLQIRIHYDLDDEIGLAASFSVLGANISSTTLSNSTAIDIVIELDMFDLNEHIFHTFLSTLPDVTNLTLEPRSAGEHSWPDQELTMKLFFNALAQSSPGYIVPKLTQLYIRMRGSSQFYLPISVIVNCLEQRRSDGLMLEHLTLHAVSGRPEGEHIRPDLLQRLEDAVGTLEWC